MRVREINSTEIAKLAGVSRSTVSRVINNYPNVPQNTREKVLKVIKENNYYPNLFGQVLAGAKTGTIVLITIDDGIISSDPIHTYLITRVIETAADYGYYVLTMVIRDSKSQRSKDKIKEVFHQRRVDGGIVMGVNKTEEFVEELVEEGFIIGILDQEASLRGESNRITYGFPNKQSASMATEYLVRLNHRNIGVINGNMNRLAGIKRYEGFVEVMKKYGLTIRQEWVLPGDFNKQSGYNAMVNLLVRGVELPTAIFTVNDSVALGALKALEEFSVSVPDDISIIGVDNHLLSEYSTPALTTVKVDFEEIIESLTVHVIKTILGEKMDKVPKMNLELLVRDSCKKI
ncbi:LacI family transcriptional regulator [Anaerobacillus alkaliphilus]|uniref:LacI family transcriptional regulator n=1 Tax=Anaerobacillus alkaliphilus TaxID=1548597 RepID=A0A4Q0VMD0_9BACI|nr:LacI family DNA-binding transcriptional regulator [Anaerobacillus alkaliphilus]RXI96333.1 LacI family transcriptional regulator [Anaerobacillus alkaliphilus]